MTDQPTGPDVRGPLSQNGKILSLLSAVIGIRSALIELSRSIPDIESRKEFNNNIDDVSKEIQGLLSAFREEVRD